MKRNSKGAARLIVSGAAALVAASGITLANAPDASAAAWRSFETHTTAISCDKSGRYWVNDYKRWLSGPGYYVGYSSYSCLSDNHGRYRLYLYGLVIE
ncbi:hypothetical protein SAMN04489812_3484 [Microlunatus soli]|uniref:Uncharacterized protein n=1 Tax=Microlunatus soli TaxID=630515 RepID=A0A1H1W5E1_9ACTN|nr:hypothetical protein SAMN04489812_3484 [Microlunatus soli]